jgi:hypothetical protein
MLWDLEVFGNKVVVCVEVFVKMWDFKSLSINCFTLWTWSLLGLGKCFEIFVN